MKKFFSWVLFLLAIFIFFLDIGFVVDGVIEIKNQYAELAARNASGSEYLGVGTDVFVMLFLLISLVGLIISGISLKIAPNRFVRGVSLVLSILFTLPLIGIIFMFFH